MPHQSSDGIVTWQCYMVASHSIVTATAAATKATTTAAAAVAAAAVVVTLRALGAGY